jgi:hypothetical protein
MKTPREILFERHQSAQPKLDALRRKALAECAEATAAPEMNGRLGPWFNLSRVPMKLWQELIWPCRRIWGGLAATWCVLLLINLNMDEAPAVTNKRTSTLTLEVLMALREQRELLAKLLDSTPPSAASPAPPAARGPRSALRDNFVLA